MDFASLYSHFRESFAVLFAIPTEGPGFWVPLGVFAFALLLVGSIVASVVFRCNAPWFPVFLGLFIPAALALVALPLGEEYLGPYLPEAFAVWTGWACAGAVFLFPGLLLAKLLLGMGFIRTLGTLVLSLAVAYAATHLTAPLSNLVANLLDGHL